MTSIIVPITGGSNSNRGHHQRPDQRPDQRNYTSSNCQMNWQQRLLHKYVALCLFCGLVSVILGIIFIVIYFVVRSHTSSLQYFETIPTYIPSVALIMNGIIIMCFTRRKNRYANLIKLSGCFCLICAVLCVIVTITTTVMHMNRIQTLHECIYAPTTRTCMCISATGSMDSHEGDTNASSHFMFHSTSSCQVVHGSLYACLRALFGLSVFSILMCIFSLMLVYQLLSHEKKKIYLEQLEARRRFQQQTYRRNFSSYLPPPPLPLPHTSVHPPFCNCADDSIYPGGWSMPNPPLPPWDLIDYRTCYRNVDESPSTFPAIGNGSPSAVHWSAWFNLPWQQHCNTSNAANINEATNNSVANANNLGLFSRLFNRSPNRTGTESHNCQSQNTITWRPLNGIPPPHMFVPRMGVGHFSPPTIPMPLSRQRSNCAARSRAANTLLHRRTRSNDGVFQHLHHMGVGSHPSQSFLPNPTAFAMWGPPPPYSQPSSTDNLSNEILQNVVHTRESSVHTCNGNDNHSSSKLSTPLSERRLLCNAFSSDGITLTIGNSESLMAPNTKGSCIVEVHVEDEGGHSMQEDVMIDDETNYDKSGKSKINCSTMPNLKRMDEQQFHAFNSLSNIPLQLTQILRDGEVTNKIQINSQPILEKFVADNSLSSNSFRESTNSSATQSIYCNSIQEPKMSESASQSSKHCITTTTDTSTSSNIVSSNSNSSSYAIDPPTDYKSTLIIGTGNTQSSPLTEKTRVTVERTSARDGSGNSVAAISSKLIYAHSMPNLNCIVGQISQPTPMSSANSTPSRPSRLCWNKMSSSGNTSTSQDLADFELELDDEPIFILSDLPMDKPRETIVSKRPVHVSPNDRGIEASLSDDTSRNESEVIANYVKPPELYTTNFINSNSSDETSTLSDVDKPDNIIVTIKSIQV